MSSRTKVQHVKTVPHFFLAININITCDFCIGCLIWYSDALRCFNCIGDGCRSGQVECDSPRVRAKVPGTISPYCVNVTSGSTRKYKLSLQTCTCIYITNYVTKFQAGTNFRLHFLQKRKQHFYCQYLSVARESVRYQTYNIFLVLVKATDSGVYVTAYHAFWLVS